MKKLPNATLYPLFFLSACIAFSQSEKELKVFVYIDNKAVTQFGIANLTTKTEGVYTDGFHVIKAKLGDQLFIASKAFENFYKSVTETDVALGKIEVYMKDGVIQLDEVVVTEHQLSYGTFTDYEPIQYTPAERRLKAANKSYYKGSGMSMSLDPLINAISGRTKKLKKRLKAETEQTAVDFLEENYKDHILNDLKLPRKYFGMFLYFVANKNKAIHKITNKRRIHFLLKRSYMEFIESAEEGERED
ncbi:hypothetical protein OOZ15_03735 [Galbibacter sp. EGI 63066]|uniref:hypothetical protein n=1 Tax=Galbibacter sp. EGI 63066 TaxID=2993559 RepID=UPI00224970ED|nr:hypothetical protein [Galbibacter sp. EGI 63066]MCX2679042.1 hypothetical protein [Galbibacter sp. EGI 63066]